MTRADFFDLCALSLEQNGAGEFVNPESIEKLHELSGIFLRANRMMNLTSLRDERSVIAYHFADCISAARSFPKNSSVIDVGSGGGMPALPLSIVRPDLKITALDATAKKTAYIERAAKELGLNNVSVITGRAEEVAFTDLRGTFDCATARAVAQLRILLELCVPLIKVDGRFVAMKGKQAKEELHNAKNAISALSCSLSYEWHGYLTDLDGAQSERAIMVFEKREKTDAVYPRKYAMILKKPL